MSSKQDKQNTNTHYGIDVWGEDSFVINDDGQVCVQLHTGDSTQQYSLESIVDLAKKQGLTLPLLIRFPQVLQHKIAQLYESFKDAASLCQYNKQYTAVYPIKVNQQRSVVETISQSTLHSVGLEAGSKAELLIILSIAKPGQIVVCNGYKDKQYLELALLAQKLGLTVYIIIEKMTELHLVLQLARTLNCQPTLGLRVRLATIAYGKWQNTGGEKAKFGLTSNELLEAVHLLTVHNALKWCQVLHFHMGSQISNLKDIQTGLTEGIRYYCELRALGLALNTVDVGGGLGIDYQGTQSRNEFSMNYTQQEYAQTIVKTIKDVTSKHKVLLPHIFTECGRAMVAHHSVLITNVIDIESPVDEKQTVTSKVVTCPLILELEEKYAQLNQNTVIETYHESKQCLCVLQERFVQGGISLTEKAYVESLYWRILAKILGLLSVEVSAHKQLYNDILAKISQRYFTNFSIFRSLPDIWAIDQIFPIIPLSLLNQSLTQHGVMRDLTCDSDGRIDHYVADNQIDAVLTTPKFSLNNAPYFGFFLVGAYQETLGDIHNLFGAPNSCVVDVCDEKLNIVESVAGETIRHLLLQVDYNPDVLLKNCLEKIKACSLDKDQACSAHSLIHTVMQGSSYYQVTPFAVKQQIIDSIVSINYLINKYSHKKIA